MNQIDLSHLTNKDGIKLDYEKRTFSLKQEETTYDYDIFVPKAFTIDINNVTNKLPDVDEVKIENMPMKIVLYTVRMKKMKIKKIKKKKMMKMMLL